MNSAISPGIVLRRARHLENDLRLTLFLRDHGKVVALAKGGQRMSSKLKALQEPFSEAEYHVFLPEHSHNARLLGGRLSQSHAALRHRFAAFQTASRCCETIEAMFPFRAPAPDVYVALQRSLAAMEAGDPPFEWMVFLLSVLKCLGHGDHSERVTEFLPADQKAVVLARVGGQRLNFDINQHVVNRASLAQAASYLEDRLQNILPRRLKSDGFYSPPIGEHSNGR